MPQSGPALLGMPDIDNLGVLTINSETIGRQLVPDNNADSRKGNCQYEKAVQTEDGMSESYACNGWDVDTQKAAQAEDRMLETCTNKRQDAETQNQHSADNTTEPSVITNPRVMGNNNNENSFLSESTKNDANSYF